MQWRVYSITFLTKMMEIMDLNAYKSQGGEGEGIYHLNQMYFPSKEKHMGEFQILILDVNIERHGLVAWVG